MVIAEQLSEYILNTSYADIPDDVKRYTKLCLFDWLGVTLGALNEEIAPILIACVEEMGGKNQATIIGKGIKTNVLFAALVNGSISHALDYDDTIAGSFIHPSVCLAPAVMAVGEHLRVSGKELITAFAIGFEIASRLGAAAGVSHYQHGWHATSTMGCFGAAAGTAKLLNLKLAQIINAFGVAGTQLSGLREAFGTMCKPFNAGKAAMDGVLSAYLAKRGFDSSKKIFEGKYGIGRVFAPKADVNKLLDGLGTEYQITGVAFKRYASALATHSTIEAIKEIKKKERLTAQNVLKIDIQLGKLPLSVVDNKEPKRILEAKFSIYHCAALAFIEGSAGHHMFTKEKLKDPKLAAFRKKVKTELNPNFSRFETKVRITTTDGSHFERYIPTPKGSPENPISFDEMKRKFKGLVYPVLSREKAKQIFYGIKQLDEMSNIQSLMALCVSDEMIKG